MELVVIALVLRLERSDGPDGVVTIIEVQSNFKPRIRHPPCPGRGLDRARWVGHGQRERFGNSQLAINRIGGLDGHRPCPVGALTVYLGGRAGLDVFVRTDLLLHSVEPCQLQARTRSVYAGFSTKPVKSRVRFVDASASDAACPKDTSYSLAPLTAL